MKKVLGILGLAAGLAVASSANAAVLRMNFEGGGDKINVTPSQNFVIEIWVDTPDGGTIGGIGTEINGDPSLVGISNSTNLPGWSSGGNVGVLDSELGAASHQFGAFAIGIPDEISGASSILLGTITAHATVLGSFPLTFSFPSNAFFLAGAAGADLPYGNAYSLSYDSTFQFGLGSPFVAPAKGGIVGQPENPITVNVVPEPAALALLGIGAIVALRRKLA